VRRRRRVPLRRRYPYSIPASGFFASPPLYLSPQVLPNLLLESEEARKLVPSDSGASKDLIEFRFSPFRFSPLKCNSKPVEGL
jgi:hypothetical protein